MGERMVSSAFRNLLAAEGRVQELEAALWAIMRVTDPGDVRVRAGREAWEAAQPVRKIARQALGLPIGGLTQADLDARKEQSHD